MKTIASFKIEKCCMCDTKKPLIEMILSKDGDLYCHKCHESHCQHEHTETITVPGYAICVCHDCGKEL